METALYTIAAITAVHAIITLGFLTYHFYRAGKDSRTHLRLRLELHKKFDKMRGDMHKVVDFVRDSSNNYEARYLNLKELVSILKDASSEKLSPEQTVAALAELEDKLKG